MVNVRTIFSTFYKLLLREVLISQRFQLDQTSKVDPLTLLEKISKNGLSQDVCVNDLGTSFPRILIIPFHSFIYFSNFTI